MKVQVTSGGDQTIFYGPGAGDTGKYRVNLNNFPSLLCFLLSLCLTIVQKLAEFTPPPHPPNPGMAAAIQKHLGAAISTCGVYEHCFCSGASVFTAPGIHRRLRTEGRTGVRYGAAAMAEEGHWNPLFQVLRRHCECASRVSG